MRKALLLAAITAALTGAPLRLATFAQSPTAQDDRLWSEFVSLLKAGKITEAHLQPEYTSKAIMLQFLDKLRAAARWDEWERRPEVYHVGQLVHFVTRLSEHGISSTYSFTFMQQDTRWFLKHFETIVVRLDRIDAPPVSTFPDLPEDKKAWMREENYRSQMMVIFRRMRSAAGSEAAFNMFRDGAGYLVQAKTWVPFHEPAKAFILYLCWEQSRLRGNNVTLEELGASNAVVTMDSIYLRLYRQTSHIQQLISEEDYVRVFETIWRDRAEAAGWNVQFDYRGSQATLRLTCKVGGASF